MLAGNGEAVERALADLAGLAQAVRARRPDVELHVDLAELRGYRYHTGFVFAAFVPGHGREVARGGRYDEIGSVFGRARAATGFSADLKTIVALQDSGAGRPADGVIDAPWSDDPVLLAAVRDLRGRGERVVQRLPGEAAQSPRRLERRGGRWVVASGGEGSERGLPGRVKGRRGWPAQQSSPEVSRRSSCLPRLRVAWGAGAPAPAGRGCGIRPGRRCRGQVVVGGGMGAEYDPPPE